MDIPGILDFLKVLAANNNREWFQEHKAEYLSVQADFEELLAGVIARLSPWDESVAHVLPRDCTYRIYRDVRFSSDKSPYKTHIGGYINARGKKSNHCGYYLHLEPGNCMLAGGSWCMPAICCGRCVSRCATALTSIVPSWKTRLSSSIFRWWASRI